MNAIHLGAWDLMAAALLILFDAALSLALRLGVHRQILIAALRMVVQLTIVGMVLRAVFASASAGATAAVILFMIAAAAREVATRPKQRLKRHMNYQISAAVVACAGFATALLALTTAVRPDPWYAPRYAIPLMGIVLGSVLNAASLALDGVLDGVVRERGRIEARLALGMDPMEAVKYQILLMFLLAGASGLASVGAALLAVRALSDERERLRLDRLRT